MPFRKRFTREEVDQMDQAGLFPCQRFELIDGDLIDEMGQNPPQAWVIRMLQDLLYCDLREWQSAGEKSH